MEVAGTTAVVIVVGVAAGAIVAAVIAAVASASTVFTTIGVLWGVGGITLTCAKLLAKKKPYAPKVENKCVLYAIFILSTSFCSRQNQDTILTSISDNKGGSKCRYKILLLMLPLSA